MKSRFNWAFELLEAKVHSARNCYTRGAAPDQERSTLIQSLSRAIEEARKRQEEFEGNDQYQAFLERYVGTLQSFIDGAAEDVSLVPQLDKLTEEITQLDDTVRAALR